jgi:hypothetical protein
MTTAPVRPIFARSIVTIGALSLHGLGSLILIFACTTRIVLLERVQSHVQVSREDLIASDAFMLWGSRTHVGVMFVAAVAFLLWFYRAYQNLSSFRSGPLRYSASKAAWSFFIPFVNLVRPFSVMRDIWQASDPTLPPFAPSPYTAAPVSPLVPTWWALFLAQGVLAWLALAPLQRGHTVDTVLASAQLMRVSYAAAIFAAASACVLVFVIQRRQQQLAEHTQLSSS